MGLRGPSEIPYPRPEQTAREVRRWEPLVPEWDGGPFCGVAKRTPAPGPTQLWGGRVALVRCPRLPAGRPDGRAVGLGASFFSSGEEKRLTSHAGFRIFPPPAVPGPDLSSEQNPTRTRQAPFRAAFPRRRRKKALDIGNGSRETGNPPLDGTGSLKTEQRRTREGGRKSSPHGGLRDSFEGLVRRDEPGSTGRWLAGLDE